MPYDSTKELPKDTKALPGHAKRIFKSAFNAALEHYGKEDLAFRVAWAAVKRDYEKDEDGKWHRKKGLAAGIFSGALTKCALPTDDAEVMNVAAGMVSGELMYFKGVLARAETNRNRDNIDRDGVAEVAASLALMPVDIEHRDQELCGVFVRAHASEDGTAVEVEGLIYARRFPDVAQGIEEGKLKLSIEARATEAVCSLCGGVYHKTSDYCDCLRNRFKGSQAVRELHGLTAYGGAVTATPAGTETTIDTDSLLLVASEIGDEEEDAEQDGLDASAADADKPSRQSVVGAGREDRKAQAARSRKYGIAVKEGGNATKPSKWKDVPDSQFGDPVNYLYPTPGKGHADDTASRFARNKDRYSTKERAIVERRIKRRQASFGEDTADGDNADKSSLAAALALESARAEIDQLAAAVAAQTEVTVDDEEQKLAAEGAKKKAKPKDDEKDKKDKGDAEDAEDEKDKGDYEDKEGEKSKAKGAKKADVPAEKPMSHEAIRDHLHRAMRNQLYADKGPDSWGYLAETYPDYAIWSEAGPGQSEMASFKVPYSFKDGKPVLGEKQPVEQQWVPCQGVEIAEVKAHELELKVADLTKQLSVKETERATAAQALEAAKVDLTKVASDLTAAQQAVAEAKGQVETLTTEGAKLQKELTGFVSKERVALVASVIGEEEAKAKRDEIVAMAQEAFDGYVNGIKVAASVAKPKPGSIRGFFTGDGKTTANDKPITSFKGSFSDSEGPEE